MPVSPGVQATNSCDQARTGVTVVMAPDARTTVPIRRYACVLVSDGMAEVLAVIVTAETAPVVALTVASR